MGNTSNLCDQGERLQRLLKMMPEGSIEAISQNPKRVCRKLDPESVSKLVEAYLAGEPVRTLTAQFNVDPTTIRKYVRQLGGTIRPSLKLNAAQVEEAAALYIEGLSTIVLADRFGVAPDTVGRALRRAGVVIRDSHGR